MNLRHPDSLWLQPPVLFPVRLSTGLSVVALVVTTLAAVYAISTPRTVLLEDDGLFLMSSATLGVSHPPGYPVHTILGWLASQIPISTAAFRVHLLSGLLGALACAVLAWVVMRRSGNPFAAAIAALAYGVSEHFWSQAILAEVYTLNALFFFSILAVCLEFAARPSRRLLIAGALLYGVSLANHWPLMVLAAPALVLTVACRWRYLLPRVFPVLAAVLIGAAVPYAWMVWRSNQDPLISFYGPLRSWRDFFFYVSRKGYSRVELSPTAGWTDKIGFAGYVVREAVRSLTPAGSVVAVAGLVWQWRNRGRAALVGEVIAFVASGLLLAFVLGFDYDFLKVAVFRPYPLVAYGLLSLWMGLGMHWAMTAARDRQPRLVPIMRVALCALPVFLAVTNWSVNNRSQDDFAARHARLLLHLLDPESVLLVYGDSDTGPVGYLHEVEHMRPDVTLYNLQGLVFRNRLMPALASTAQRNRALTAFLNDTSRPVYHMTDKVLPPTLAEEHLGFLKQVLPGGKPGMPRPRFRPEAEQFFRELLAMPLPRDRWVRMTRNQLLHQYGNFLGLAQLSDQASLRQQTDPLVALARANYYSLNGMVEMLTEYGPNRSVWMQASKYLDEADRLTDDSLDDERLSREYYLRGFLAFKLGDSAAAEDFFRRSVLIFPSPDNASRLALTQLEQIKQQQPLKR